ncbi:hypothetical protein DPMN_065446 [Dreissena polymorpha]|uniref:Uncharacterized protein n=1 Tax=Dreissena polymorpha TaxID=45954 RepID=A0A9D4BS87_DREPO|nr:hypothetical protein DPMN_065446 [Dreissena polymorpha]
MFAVLFVRSCITQVPELATIMDRAPVAMEKDSKALEDLGQNLSHSSKSGKGGKSFGEFRRPYIEIQRR